MIWRRFRRHKAGMGALVALVLLGSLAAFAPSVAPYDPRAISRSTLRAPCASHFLGTDNLGRDVSSQILHGLRVALVVAVAAAAISTLAGTVVGGVAGLAGGPVDAVLMRFTDGFMVIPSFFLILLVAATYGSSIVTVTVMIGMTSWPTTARVVRMQFISLKEREFVMAARAQGASTARLMLCHLLPNALPAITVVAALRAGGAVLQEASLSFLGLGDANVVSLGRILMSALQYMQLAWWPAVFPGLALFVIVLAFNLFSDGVNDALNPRVTRKACGS